MQKFPLPNVAQTATDYHRVRLEVVGEKFRMFVDGQPAFEFTDANVLASGGFGLFITSDKATPSTVQIRNLRVYAAESSTINPSR